MSRSRLAWLEEQLDRDDLTDLQFESYNSEANAIAAQLKKDKDERDAKRAQELEEERAQLALDKIASLTEEEVEKMYQDTCLKYQDVNGQSFKAWYEQSQKYYTIREDFAVVSKAMSDKDELARVEPQPSKAAAQYYILQLIKWKFYDHAVRGATFKYDIAK